MVPLSIVAMRSHIIANALTVSQQRDETVQVTNSLASSCPVRRCRYPYDRELHVVHCNGVIAQHRDRGNLNPRKNVMFVCTARQRRPIEVLRLLTTNSNLTKKLYASAAPWIFPLSTIWIVQSTCWRRRHHPRVLFLRTLLLSSMTPRHRPLFTQHTFNQFCYMLKPFYKLSTLKNFKCQLDLVNNLSNTPNCRYKCRRRKHNKPHNGKRGNKVFRRK